MSRLQALTGPKDLKAMSIAELEELAQEIREAIVEQVQKSGGHLAPNLGVVELSLALHRVFDFSHDRLLFDVGHQCYPHKLVTGRYPLLSKLRTREGMSGFPEPLESPFDLFRVGHAGTGISTAVGMARGDQLNGEAYDARHNPKGRCVVTLIGDASIVNGVAMEGLNNAGTLRRQFLVVLNDNGMSISKPQGAIAGYFDRVRVSHTYADFKKSAHELLKRIPGGSMLEEAYHRAGEATKALITEDSWFEKFGLVTVGPIDGHDLSTLIEFLAEVRDIDRPVLLHVKTIKGRGLDVAEHDATKFHSPRPFKVTRAEANSCRVEMSSSGRSFTTAFGEALASLMERDARVVACTAAMPDGTGIAIPLERFPDRTWDVGICESHAMDMMAGLAKSGFKPFIAVYSTFLQRAFDQVFQEVSLQGLAVRICLDRAGLVGGDGAVHHGFCDIALLRTLPGGALLAAIDEPSLVAALDFMLGYEEGFSAVRYPRDSVSNRLAGIECPGFELGKSRCLTPGLDVLDGALPDAIVIAYGTPAIAALDAADLLREEYRVAVYDARFAKPIDDMLVGAALRSGRPVLTVEDHGIVGGFGSAFIERANELGLNASRVRRLGIPDRWILQDSRSKQLAEVGLDAAGIARAIRSAVEDAPTVSAGAEVAVRAGTRSTQSA
ncbi:MAG: 1-deoxy-D-xylulose-5-phosphate synthase [Phycisphaerales bacterium]